MRINITSATPILVQANTHDSFRFKVYKWHVKGVCIADKDECQCKTRQIDLYLELDRLEVSQQELKELVKDKLKST